MPLPNTGMDAVPFTPLTAEFVDQIIENIEALAAGTGMDDGIIDSRHYVDGSIDPEHLLAGTGTSWVWQDWTPTYSNITPGNGTVTAKYIQIGKTIHARYTLQCGSTTAIGNSPGISFPVAAHAVYEDFVITIGGHITNDANGATYFGPVTSTPADANLFFIRFHVDGQAGFGNNMPFTEAATDTIALTITYEAA